MHADVDDVNVQAVQADEFLQYNCNTNPKWCEF